MLESRLKKMADQIASAREAAERKRKEKIAELRKKAKAV